MKCNNCGFENKNTAKFCSKCGESLDAVPVIKNLKNNSKVIIIALLAIIVILGAALGFFMLNSSNNSLSQADSSQANTTNAGSVSSDNSNQETTTSVSSESKEWVLIGSYSGSGSGTQSISVPAGQIMIKLSAYPIKNYATNHLYVSGSNGESAGVDWGSTSAVETRSDSLSYTSSSPQTFVIDYYETVSWQVDFYKYE